jgi:hypothetical protein
LQLSWWVFQSFLLLCRFRVVACAGPRLRSLSAVARPQAVGRRATESSADTGRTNACTNATLVSRAVGCRMTKNKAYFTSGRSSPRRQRLNTSMRLTV